MHIYLPIAEMSANVFGLLLLGGATGILSGMFGIGGGFLMTPLLIFMGVTPAVAVATSSNQIVAASASGFLGHWRRGNVDFQMGLVLLVGGLVGSTLGVELFTILKALGQIDLVISLSYVFFLGAIGVLMAVESIRAIWGNPDKRKDASEKHQWVKKLPFKVYFKRSDMEVSILMPLIVGLLVGIMVSLMGIGGGFIMIPAMVYLLGMPTSVVIGTSLFQIIFTSSHVTIMHAINTQSVDIVLAAILLSGSVIGAQYGSRYGAKVAPEKLRGLLAGMVLAVCLRLAWGLLVTPDNLFTVTAELTG